MKKGNPAALLPIGVFLLLYLGLGLLLEYGMGIPMGFYNVPITAAFLVAILTACLLDTFSCIAQGIIPYGAQVLVALSAAGEMGCALSAFDLLPKLYYPMALLACSLIAILFPARQRKA